MDLDFPYTERDAPEERVVVERDLRRIVEGVRAADPHLDALVLTGGFSRGEGTVHDGKPVNDYDLVAVRARPGGGALYRRLHHALSEEVGIEVDLMPVWRARLPRLSPKLFWLDLRLGGRVIAGDPRALDAIPRFDVADLPRAEAARLLGNRAAGLLLALPGAGEPVDARQRDLQATKALLAAMDAELIASGRYAARLRDRLALSQDHPDHKLFALAVDWKLGAEPQPMGDWWWNDAAAALLRAVERTETRATRDGWAERAVHALRARRLAAHPSRDVRLAAWDLVAMSRFPDGPSDADAAARAVARIDRRARPSPWPALKARFFAARARTLQ